MDLASAFYVRATHFPPYPRFALDKQSRPTSCRTTTTTTMVVIRSMHAHKTHTHIIEHTFTESRANRQGDLILCRRIPTLKGTKPGKGSSHNRRQHWLNNRAHTTTMRPWLARFFVVIYASFPVFRSYAITSWCSSWGLGF